VTTSSSKDNGTLIDELLAEQQRLTAVERFAQAHERGEFSEREKSYRRLLPATAPAPGQQYAFEVNLDQCSGCKACVSACHSLNGLDDGEAWRDVGLIFSDDWQQPFQQTITTACHHCVEPGCLEGCPVLAYDKDPLTGIVRHLDDQCIGCQYCVMKCPYDVPKYSKKRGIVRKCDMCANRLAVGEAPACVQACPHEAIRITLVETKALEMKYRDGRSRREEALTFKAEGGKIESLLTSAATVNGFLPAAPDPSYTLPTTRYKSAKPLPIHLLAGDHARVTPADSHLPLVFMLVLTQLSVGVSVAATFAQPAKWLALVAVVVGALALGIASLHLGKPLKAWRAFLGWRKSWFSREVIVFGGFVPLAALNAASFWFAPLAPFQKPLAVAAAVTGLLGVACSAMIYADTRREFWRASQCFGKFFGTAALLGAVTTLAVGAMTSSASNSSIAVLVAAMVVATVWKFSVENSVFRQRADRDALVLTPLNKTARLLEDELGLPTRIRTAFGVIGGLVLPLLLVFNRANGFTSAAWLAPVALALCVAGELLERYLFFTAVAPVKMPGGVAA
jgi:formate dehydrogenase iron-sulfur subunit